eukprot:scaffold61765_cov60-Phaeocystis_antarctica.AAC.3
MVAAKGECMASISAGDGKPVSSMTFCSWSMVLLPGGGGEGGGAAWEDRLAAEHLSHDAAHTPHVDP